MLFAKLVIHSLTHSISEAEESHTVSTSWFHHLSRYFGFGFVGMGGWVVGLKELMRVSRTSAWLLWAYMYPWLFGLLSSFVTLLQRKMTSIYICFSVVIVVVLNTVNYSFLNNKTTLDCCRYSSNCNWFYFLVVNKWREAIYKFVNIFKRERDANLYICTLHLILN